MKLNISLLLIDPLILMILAVFIGMLFGRIKIYKFSFGVSGTLFSGLFVGWIAIRHANTFQKGDELFKIALKFIVSGVVDKNYFTLFLILFIATVGLLAAKDIGLVIRKHGGKFFVLAFIITFTGAISTYGLALLSSNTSSYEIIGVYTGALTSSPGFAAALETTREQTLNQIDKYELLSKNKKELLLSLIDSRKKLIPENTPILNEEQKIQILKNAESVVSIGHSITYPFGLLIVILAINFLPIIFRIDVKKEKELFQEETIKTRKIYHKETIKETSFDIVAYSLVCLIGYTLGAIKIYLGPMGYFNLGSTGGVLTSSLILGHIGKIGIFNFRMDSTILGFIRQLTLAFLLAIVGLRNGFKVFEILAGKGIYLVIASILIGIIAILIGFFIGRYMFKMNWLILSGAICGGMTSTPGLGVAIEAIGSDDPAAGYGAIYPFALIGMVIFSIILHKLPM